MERSPVRPNAAARMNGQAAFANIYRNGAAIAGRLADNWHLDFPIVEDGARGLVFLGAIMENARGLKKWTGIARNY